MSEPETITTIHNKMHGKRVAARDRQKQKDSERRTQISGEWLKTNTRAAIYSAFQSNSGEFPGETVNKYDTKNDQFVWLMGGRDGGGLTNLPPLRSVKSDAPDDKRILFLKAKAENRDDSKIKLIEAAGFKSIPGKYLIYFAGYGDGDNNRPRFTDNQFGCVIAFDEKEAAEIVLQNLEKQPIETFRILFQSYWPDQICDFGTRDEVHSGKLIFPFSESEQYYFKHIVDTEL